MRFWNSTRSLCNHIQKTRSLCNHIQKQRLNWKRKSSVESFDDITAVWRESRLQRQSKRAIGCSVQTSAFLTYTASTLLYNTWLVRLLTARRRNRCALWSTQTEHSVVARHVIKYFQVPSLRSDMIVYGTHCTKQYHLTVRGKPHHTVSFDVADHRYRRSQQRTPVYLGVLRV